MARARIDQTRRALLFEHVIEAGLIATDAGIDFIGTTGRRLDHEFGIGQQGPRHRHHVGTAVGDNFFSDIGRVDAVGRDERDADLGFKFLRHPRKCAARHRSRNGRHARFMPADTGVDDGGTGFFDRFGEHHDFIPRLSVGNEIEHR